MTDKADETTRPNAETRPTAAAANTDGPPRVPNGGTLPMTDPAAPQQAALIPAAEATGPPAEDTFNINQVVEGLGSQDLAKVFAALGLARMSETFYNHVLFERAVRRRLQRFWPGQPFFAIMLEVLAKKSTPLEPETVPAIADILARGNPAEKGAAMRLLARQEKAGIRHRDLIEQMLICGDTDVMIAACDALGEMDSCYVQNALALHWVICDVRHSKWGNPEQDRVRQAALESLDKIMARPGFGVAWSAVTAAEMLLFEIRLQANLAITCPNRLVGVAGRAVARKLDSMNMGGPEVPDAEAKAPETPPAETT